MTRSVRTYYFLPIVIVAMLLGVSGLDANAAENKATITALEGTAHVLRPANPDGLLAKVGDVLQANDAIEAGDDALVEINIPNVGQINLKPETNLIITDLSYDPRTGAYTNKLRSTVGKLRINLIKTKPAPAFEVTTPTSVVTVQGVLSYLFVDNESTEAAFFNGTGRVTNTVSSQSVKVGDGEWTSSDKKGEISKPEVVGDDDYRHMSGDWDPMLSRSEASVRWRMETEQELVYDSTFPKLPKTNIKVGSVEIHPTAAIKETWDSNIFLEPTKAHNDWITDFNIGVHAKTPIAPASGKEMLLRAGYLADWIRFSNNDTENRVDHHAYGHLRAEVNDNWLVRVNDSFVRTADPPNLERVELEERNQNIFGVTLTYKRDISKVRLDYSLRTDTYDNVSNIDRNDNRFTAAYYYLLFPKAALFAEFFVGGIGYRQHVTNADSVYFQPSLGVEGTFWPRLTGTFQVGYKHSSYDRNDAKDDINYSNITAFANLRFEATERSSINLYGEKTSDESSYASNNFYDLNRIGIRVDSRLLKNLSMSSGPYFQYDRYPSNSVEDGMEAKRHESIWGIDTGLTYIPRDYLTLGLNYDWRQRDSRFDRFDYDDHKVSLRASLLF